MSCFFFIYIFLILTKFSLLYSSKRLETVIYFIYSWTTMVWMIPGLFAQPSGLISAFSRVEPNNSTWFIWRPTKPFVRGPRVVLILFLLRLICHYQYLLFIIINNPVILDSQSTCDWFSLTREKTSAKFRYW